MIMEVSKLESVKIIRIHTRVLTYCPELITEYLCMKMFDYGVLCAKGLVE